MSGDERYLPDGVPLPEVTPFTRAFVTSGELALQVCVSCSNIQHPPGEVCFSCGGTEFNYRSVVPSGVISSYTVVHHATQSDLAQSVPYNVVIVELDAHPEIRIVGNLIEAGAEELQIGRRVIGTWTKPLHGEGPEPVRLLQWRVLT